MLEKITTHNVFGGKNVLVILVSAVTLSGCGAKYAADVEMQALCAKDGGIKVYENVTLSASEFSEWGFPLYRYWTVENAPEDRLGPKFRYVQRTEFLKRGDTLRGEVEMFKSVQKIYRRNDQKLLGEEIKYGRSGGDAFINRILGGHPSASMCPKSPAGLLTSVFVKR